MRPAVLLVTVLALAGPAAPPANAQDTQRTPPSSPGRAGDIEQLRLELEAVRREYDARIAAIEQRLAALDAAAAPSPAHPEADTPPGAVELAPPAPVETQVAPPATPPPSTGGVLSKIFNPDIAVVGNVLGAIGTNAVESTAALEFDEAETSFQAVIDPYARGDIFIGFGPDGAEVEEAFITFNTLPGGLLVKAGKLRGAFGKVNAMHTHALPWTDRPLVTRTLVGGDEGLADAGVSVSRLILNPLFFLEATGEVYGGRSEVFTGNERSQVSWIGRLRGYRDLTEGTNLDVGGSYAWGHTDVEAEATRQLAAVDATFRYRPLRRAIYRRLLARTELVWSRDRLLDASPTSFGLYASGEYQFARRWFAGGRYDYAERPLEPSLADKGGAAILTFWPSEFSQVRGQYRLTRYAEGVRAHEFLFQFLFSIGAHGGHAF